MPIKARMIPTTSSFLSGESCSHHESARAAGGAGWIGFAFPLTNGGVWRAGTPFFGGMVLAVGFEFFLGGMDGFKIGMIFCHCEEHFPRNICTQHKCTCDDKKIIAQMVCFL
jgi:hypothetical protein